jgi:hypothetical protein
MTFHADELMEKWMTAQNIEKHLLKLDAESRAHIAYKLLSSLDELTEDENEKLWAYEALRRDQEISDKSSTARSAQSVFKHARKKVQ